LSEILPSNSLGPGPDEVGLKGLKLLHLRHHSQQIQDSKPKKHFFIADSKTCWVFRGFEQISSTIT